MKKVLVTTILIIVVLLCGFKAQTNNNELRGIFISYIDEKNILSSDIELSKNNIKEVIRNIKNKNINLIILQVRSNSDSIYNSKYYPYPIFINNYETKEYFDVLSYFLEETHKNNIKLYVWINPYRVRTTEDISTITELNPAYKYINTDYLYINNGIYYNPSKKEVEELILNGIEEIVSNYKVDGLLYDDYFYPSNDIDINDYNEYIEKNDYIELKEYHLNIINNLVEKTHNICKKNNVLFGISPDGNIENNYDYISADIYKWLSSDKYIDFIMPQIYYGFYNEKMPFYNTIKNWDSLISNDIDLIIALALYKSGNYDKYALSGSNEWIDNTDIIRREILLSRNLKHYKGFSLFRYDYLFRETNQNEYLKKEISNLQTILN